MAQKWDFKTHKYKPYKLPGYSPMVTELHDTINCSNCGELQAFGDCYTSLTIHDDIGFGYPVCESCYNDEFIARKEAKEAQQIK